jgi:hypothetical protein
MITHHASRKQRTMELQGLGEEQLLQLQSVLGYLNFSSGKSDPAFLKDLSQTWKWTQESAPGESTCENLERLLRTALGQMTSEAFSNSDQAVAVIDLVFCHVLPAYQDFHRDTLHQQGERHLFNAFFLGRVFEAVLAHGAPWQPAASITETVIGELNRYVGHRPVATLETHEMEPYAHEWICPVPLYIEGAGSCSGPYQAVIDIALEMLQQTETPLLRQACFDSQLLEELAFDPRPYDFDHPVNRRPNYHFGQWDPHHIDNRGNYRRYVIQQVTLDALVARISTETDLAEAELTWEAGAVLAGTILMATGISGTGPGFHNSEVSLGNLLPQIASYRDDFYRQLLQRSSGRHAERLKQEAIVMQQPFAGARKHLNTQLSHLRASQLIHGELARVFARLGSPQAASRQAQVIPAVAARIRSQIDCLLIEGEWSRKKGNLAEAVTTATNVMELISRAIECGALVDPWNVLYFDGQFSLFAARENSIHDHRIDDLIDLVEQLLTFCGQVWQDAAAKNQVQVVEQIDQQFSKIANWWRQFAIHEISALEATDPLESYQAAKHVSTALSVWHQGGAETGNVRFWATHADIFDGPEAHAPVIAALLNHGDLVASMALLMHWLSQAAEIPLRQADHSFFDLIQRWLSELQTSSESSSPAKTTAASQATWPMIKRLFEHLEANADHYGQVPKFALEMTQLDDFDGEESADSDPSQQDEPEDNQDELFGAAYEGMTYHDSTDDGVEGEIYDTDQTLYRFLIEESQRLTNHLEFFNCLAQLWKTTALILVQTTPEKDSASAIMVEQQRAAVTHWIDQIQQYLDDLNQLLRSIQSFPVFSVFSDQTSMQEYDRDRMMKDTLLERIIETCVEMSDTERLLQAARHCLAQTPDPSHNSPDTSSEQASAETAKHLFQSMDQAKVVPLMAALFDGQRDRVRDLWEGFIDPLKDEPLLYVPIAKGGEPATIVAIRSRQRMIQDLLTWLPRLGLLSETRELIEIARAAERNEPIPQGAVTEFDELFTIGYRAIVDSLISSSESWQVDKKLETDASLSSESTPANDATFSEDQLVSCLEKLTETLLESWLAHSRTLRLSVLEKVHGETSWNRLVEFIETYGVELFTQQFLALGNIRGILHQGIDPWLTNIQERNTSDIQSQLFDDLDRDISRQTVSKHLGLILEAIVENYGDYRDYNSTTTQSDQGNLLYTLLDLLRLRIKYDRICWNLKPIVLAHELLVRRQKPQAAQLWFKALASRIEDEADYYLSELTTLQNKYAIRVTAIHDRLNERFVMPMKIAHLRALVEPVFEELSQGDQQTMLKRLEQETMQISQEPSGSGLDLPNWILDLHNEVERVRRPRHLRQSTLRYQQAVPSLPLTLEEIDSLLSEWSERY